MRLFAWFGVCGTDWWSEIGAAVLIGLAIIYVRQYLKGRRRDEVMKRGVSDRPTSSFTTPLMGQRGVFGTSHMALSSLMRDPPSHRLGAFPVLSLPSSEEPPSDESSSNESHSPSSPYSDGSEHFAFPILSADGHLLPPAPASRRSYNDANQAGDGSQRPLPSPPLVSTSPILSPRPLTAKRFSYQPARSRSPSPERGRRPLFGLYPEVGVAYDSPFEILREDFDSGSAGIR